MNIRLAGALFAASMLSVPAQAADYLFSYTFNSGEIVTGSFTGTESSGLVTIESGITMKLNGVDFAGPLSARGSTAVAGDGTQCGVISCFTAPAVMSADPSKNNFLIANFGANGADFGNNYFYIFPWANSPLGLGLQAVFEGNFYNQYNGQYVPANWSLSAVEAPIPEPASWAMLIAGFGIAGAMMRRRSQSTVRFA